MNLETMMPKCSKFGMKCRINLQIFGSVFKLIGQGRVYTRINKFIKRLDHSSSPCLCPENGAS